MYQQTVTEQQSIYTQRTHHKCQEWVAAVAEGLET